MTASAPQYLLFTESLRHARGARMWRFLLLELGTDHSVSASDIEQGVTTSRAELLALVRGLEAIDQPGRVKLITGSSYLNRGLRQGLKAWRAQDWHWERFGRRVPVRNCDLWKRIERALEFHSLDCLSWTNPHSSFEKAIEMVPEYDEVVDSELLRTEEEPAVMVVRKPRRRSGNQSTRIAAAARQTMGGVGRKIQALLDPPLASAG